MASSFTVLSSESGLWYVCRCTFIAAAYMQEFLILKHIAHRAVMMEIRILLLNVYNDEKDGKRQIYMCNTHLFLQNFRSY